MEKTPLAMRKHIAIVGKTNSGKSTLFNALLGQDTAIVSDVSGTTTDSVTKAMELIPYGPVALMDTAGFGDDTALGQQRMKKTTQLLKRANLVLNVTAAGDFILPVHAPGAAILTVFTKCEQLSPNALNDLKQNHPDAIYLSYHSTEGLNDLRSAMIRLLKAQEREDSTIIGGLLPEGSIIVMVTPIDSAAPKGRLILPQVQLLRDCLDHNMTAHVTKETTLPEALSHLDRIDLVVTDSQAFKLVDTIVPPEIPLTSFSMLLAHQKGNFGQYLAGADAIESLKTGDKILVLEGCTHNSTHEDIGRVKIPTLIQKKTGAVCDYTYCTGYEFPENISDFSLVLSCGMCMINKQEVQSRLTRLQSEGVPTVNYGIALAYLNGILDRAKKIFNA